MLTIWTGSWAVVFVIAAIFNILAAVMAFPVLRRCDAEPRHRLRAKSTPSRYRVRNGRLLRITLLLSEDPSMKSHLMWDSTQLKFSGAIVGMTAAVNRTSVPPCTARI